jgi:hypothetical protein
MLNPVDIENHTLIVCPVEFIPHIQTQFTKDGEPSPAIRVNVVDFVDSANPVVYKGVLWFNVSLYNNLKRQIGQFVAGRIGKGQASTGRSAPWLLNDITSEAEWMAVLGHWLDNTPEGAAFQAESTHDVQMVQNQGQVSALSAPAPAAPPVAAPAPAPAAAPRPLAPAPVAPPAAPAAAPSSPAPAGDLAAVLANLPAEEQARMLATLGMQAQASS